MESVGVQERWEVNEEVRDALAFLKSELRTIEGFAVNAKDQEDFLRSRGNIIHSGRDSRTLVLFTLCALTTIVLDLERRLSNLETKRGGK